MKRRDFITRIGMACAVLPGLSWAAKPCPPKLLAADGHPICGSVEAEADWQARISGPGVVWYHDFRSADEVDAFRWAGGVGNDPSDIGDPGTVIWRQGDGITGGACLETFRPAGSADGAVWWRPFSPLQAPGNGKFADDPGANGSIAARVWNPADANELANHSSGFYGHESLHGTGSFDGTEYWLQFRFKLDSRRLNQAEGGKLLYHTINEFSLSSQEIVVEGYENGGNGGLPMFSMYRSGGTPLDSANDNQPGNERGVCDFPGSIGACWWWDVDNYDTVMFHIVPGVPGGSPQTLIEVFAAHSGETEFTRIWHQFVNMPMETAFARGYNAIIASQYMNGLNLTEFHHRYDQFIFSTQPIPCPGSNTSTGTAPAWFTALAHLEWTAPVGNWLGDNAVKDPLAGGANAGDTGHESIITAWTGMLADSGTRTIAMLANGGHRDYYGNEVYSCDLGAAAPQWIRRRDATQHPGVTQATLYEYPDGTPAPTHSTNAQIAANGRWFQLGMTSPPYSGSNGDESRYWEYDPAAETWLDLGQVTASEPQATAFGTASAFWPDGPGGGLLIRVGQDTTVYSTLANPGVALETGPAMAGGGSAIFCDVDTDNAVLLAVQFGNASYRWRKIDSTAARTSSENVIVPTGTPPPVDDRWNIVYDPHSRSYLTWGGGHDIYKLTPTVDGSGNYTALTWTHVTGTGVLPVQGDSKMYGKIQLIRDMGNGDAALVIVPRYAFPDVYICRLKIGQPI